VAGLSLRGAWVSASAPSVSQAWMTSSARTRRAPDAVGEIGGLAPGVSPDRAHAAAQHLILGGERAEIEIAMSAIGMTPTGFAAEAALLAARGTPMTLDATVARREAFAALQWQLFEARMAVNRFGNLVNQAVGALHSTGLPPIEALARATVCVHVRSATSMS